MTFEYKSVLKMKVRHLEIEKQMVLDGYDQIVESARNLVAAKDAHIQTQDRLLEVLRSKPCFHCGVAPQDKEAHDA